MRSTAVLCYCTITTSTLKQPPYKDRHATGTELLRSCPTATAPVTLRPIFLISLVIQGDFQQRVSPPKCMYALLPNPSDMPSQSPRLQYPINTTPIAVAVQSKAWVYGRSYAATVGSNPAGGMDDVVCCQIEVSATDQSLFQRSVVCLCVIEEPHTGGLEPLGL